MASKRPNFHGIESEYTRKLREATLERTIITRCAICDVSLRASAHKGMRWFRKHKMTKAHKRAVFDRRNK